MDGAPAYRYPWGSATEANYARIWPEVGAQPKECPHCRRPWIPVPLDYVDELHGGSQDTQFIGTARCRRAGCWGKSAVFSVGKGWWLWPIRESPRDRERAGLPVSAAEIAEYEAESRRQLADEQRDVANRVESAVAGLETLADDVEAAIPEFLRRGRERRRKKPKSEPKTGPSREEAADAL